MIPTMNPMKGLLRGIIGPFKGPIGYNGDYRV